MFARCLEIITVLYQFDTQRTHGVVLLDAVAVRHDDDGGDTETPAGEADRLTVVAPGGGNDPGPGARGVSPRELGVFTLQLVEQDQTTTDLEGSDRPVPSSLDRRINPSSL